MTEMERLNTELQAVRAKIRAIIRWWEEEEPITDALIKDAREHLSKYCGKEAA